MKKGILLLLIAFSLFACGGNSSPKNTTTTDAGKDRIEVLSFHGKQRCVTCRAIEKLTQEVVETDYADQVKKGTVVFKVVDITLPENEALTDKYEVSWSALFINGWKDGEETANDLTEFAFGNARNNPEQFKQGIRAKIDELLKK